MKDDLTQFAQQVNAFCARLNDGLTAVALILGLLVVTVGALRAQELVPQMASIMQLDDPQSTTVLER